MAAIYRTPGVSALLAAMLTASCTSTGSVGNASAGTPSTVPSRDNAASSAASPSVTASGTAFDLYTHCGVENARIHGVWWHAKPPLYNKRRNGPPAGWGDPYQTGTLTLVSDDRAVFEALGRQVVFVPAPDNQPVRICD